MSDFITIGFVFNILKATLFSATYIILFILPIFVGYFFYKKYLNKLSPENNTSTLRIIIEIFAANCVAGIVHFLSLLTLLYVSIKYNITLLQMGSSYIALIIMAIAYYLILRVSMSLQSGIKKDIVKQVASNTTGSTFGVFLLLGFVIGLLYI